MSRIVETATELSKFCDLVIYQTLIILLHLQQVVALSLVEDKQLGR
jgi:hypothetical protein